MKHQIIRNIRYGLATNSSSTHSIIFNKTNKLIDKLILEDGEFEWENFIAKSKEAKHKYMVAQLLTNLPEVKRVMNFIGLLEENEYLENLSEYHVDHQSILHLPKDYGGKHIHLDFFHELHDFIVENDFVITGGNDNDESFNPVIPEKDYEELFDTLYYANEKSRTYKNNNYWVFFSRNYKKRIAFHDDDLEPKIPELIDLKITDYCDKNCNFCYQNSNINGLHMEMNNLKKILNGIPYSAITEFAIGGGEPTRHPEFKEIITKIKNNKHIVNFTTKNYNLFNNEELVNAIKKNVSGIAYSIDNEEPIQGLIKKHKKYFGKDVQQYFHVIPEIINKETMTKILQIIEKENKKKIWGESPIYITFLGFKPIGRGEKIKIKTIESLFDYILSEIHSTPIGVDTKIANDYEEILKNHKIDKRLYTKKEGEFSMYIDAVKMKGYKSSYQLENPINFGSKMTYQQEFDMIEDSFKTIKEYSRVENK